MSESAQSRLVQPIDRLAIALIVLLSLIMGLLIWGGTACEDECLFHAGAKVSSFSWQNKTIGGQDRAFILTFNRPMDRDSVAENLTITPPLLGKISWSGLRLAYVGTEGEEKGRLVLSNWTRSQKIILTPQNLTVFDFKPDPQGNFLLFSAADRLTELSKGEVYVEKPYSDCQQLKTCH